MKIILYIVGCILLGVVIIYCLNMVKFNNQNFDNIGIIKLNKNII